MRAATELHEDFEIVCHRPTCLCSGTTDECACRKLRVVGEDRAVCMDCGEWCAPYDAVSP